MSDNTRGELATGIASLLISVAGLAQLAAQPSTPVMGGDLGPTFLPLLLLYMLAVLGAVLVIKTGYRLWRRGASGATPETAPLSSEEPDEPAQPVLSYARYLPLIVFAATCACVFAFPRLGFDWSVGLFFLGVGLFLHRIKMGAFTLRGIALCAAEAALLTAALSLMLRFVLQIPLP